VALGASPWADECQFVIDRETPHKFVQTDTVMVGDEFAR